MYLSIFLECAGITLNPSQGVFLEFAWITLASYPRYFLGIGLSTQGIFLEFA